MDQYLTKKPQLKSARLSRSVKIQLELRKSKNITRTLNVTEPLNIY